MAARCVSDDGMRRRSGDVWNVVSREADDDDEVQDVSRAWLLLRTRELPVVTVLLAGESGLVSWCCMFFAIVAGW